MRYFLFAAAAAIACLGCDENTTSNSTEKSKAAVTVGTATTGSASGVSAAATPVARFSISPRKGDTRTNFNFDGSSSEGTIATYTWDFGDGQTGAGPTIQHKFQDTGRYKVRLTVVDSGSSSDSKKKNVRISEPGGGGGGGGGGQKCVYTNPRRDTWFFKVISSDQAAKTIIAEFAKPVTCANVFYLCGDVRIGGIKPGEKEYWIGTICEMWDLGNNRFRIHLVDGRYWVDDGETGTYVWPQYDCVPGQACQAFGY